MHQHRERSRQTRLSGRRAGAAAGLALAAVLVPALLAGCGTAKVSTAPEAHTIGPVPSHTATPAPLPSAGQPAWLVTRAVLSTIAASPATAARLRGATVFEVLQLGQEPLPGVSAEPVVTFGSAAELVQAVRGGLLPRGTYGVMYDPESWSFTPVSEQRDPVAAATAAAEAAHAHGLRLFVAPALDLASEQRGGSGPYWQRILASGLIGRLAKVADLVELQAQSLERSTGTFTTFVTTAAAQARSAHQGITLLAGLSTNPPGASVDAGELAAAISATKGIVSGYWLNVPDPGARCPACGEARPYLALQVVQAAP